MTASREVDRVEDGVEHGVDDGVGGDREAVNDLLSRYLRHLDRDRDRQDWLSEVFTDDAVVRFPIGRFRGLGELAEFGRMAAERVERTQHVGTNVLVDLDADRATLTATLSIVHVWRREAPGEHFGLGGCLDATALRTPAGWRFAEMDFDVVWTTGAAPLEP